MADNSFFSIVSAAFKKAMEHIHKQGRYSPEMLSDKNVSELINATSSVLSEKLDSLSVKQEIPDDLAATLRKNIFYFSGFKTHHELEEASRMLQSDDGGFKPFGKFYQDVKAIDATYNRNYLQAEYNFATASTQMAVKWKEWERTADRYDLQYRTAGDDRVREEHRELEGITLPMTDPFWNEYFPPNGWNCRCTAVRVRKGKYPTSDSDDAIQKGKNCTATPKQQIFRFNPGKQEKIFPEKHPYFPKGCGNCEYNFLYDKNNPNCKACVRLQNINSENNELIKSRAADFKKYRNDKDYKDVSFDKHTGALKATHIGHNSEVDDGKRYWGLTSGQLEKSCQDELYRMKHSAILCDESKAVNGDILPSLDLNLDGELMDIRSITTNGYYGAAILSKNKQLGKFNRRTDIDTKSESLCLYFHDKSLYSEKKMMKSINYYKFFRKNDGSLISRRIKRIYCVVNGEDDIIIFDIK